MRKLLILCALFFTVAANGYTLDECERNALLEFSPRTLHRIDKRRELNICDVMNMHEAGICDEVIIGVILDTRSSYHLTTSDIIRLKNFGLSQKLIDTMIRSNNPS